MPAPLSADSENLGAIARREVEQLHRQDAFAHAPIIDRLRKAVDFNAFAFSGIDLDHCRVGQGIYLATNMPEGLTRTYNAEQLMKVDPIVLNLSEENPIVQWVNVVDQLDSASPKAKRLLQVLDYYAVAPRTSFTFWNRGRMYGAATFTRDDAFCEDELVALNFLARAAHSYLSQLVVGAINQRLGLSRGEIKCLRAAAEGLTSEEIAQKVGYSSDTVSTYLKNATKKLSAGNRTQAIAQAIRRGIID